MFGPEPLAIRMMCLQHERRASFQVRQSLVRRDIGLQNGMDVIRSDMDAEQMPGTMCARIENGVQNSNAVLRAEDKLGSRHEPPGLLLPSRVGGDDGRSPVSMIARYRTCIGAMQVCAVSGEGEQDTNRFAHGSETQLYRSQLGSRL